MGELNVGPSLPMPNFDKVPGGKDEVKKEVKKDAVPESVEVEAEIEVEIEQEGVQREAPEEREQQSGSGSQSESGGSSDENEAGKMMEVLSSLRGVSKSSLKEAVDEVRESLNVDRIASSANLKVDPSVVQSGALLNPSVPTLAPANKVNMTTAQKTLQGNPWFNTLMATALILSTLEIVKIQKQIKGVEGNLSIAQMQRTIALAKEIASKIMAKAELEITQLTAQMIVAIVCFAIGAAAAVAGGIASARAGIVNSNVKIAKQDLAASPNPMRTTGNWSVNRPLKVGESRGSANMPQARYDAALKAQGAKKWSMISSAATLFGPYQMQMIEKIGDSAIQIYFKKQIAQIDADIEMLRAYMQNVARMYDSNLKHWTDASAIIDSALQNLRSWQDSNTNAFNYTRG